jgi:hypothetical protein
MRLLVQVVPPNLGYVWPQPPRHDCAGSKVHFDIVCLLSDFHHIVVFVITTLLFHQPKSRQGKAALHKGFPQWHFGDGAQHSG